MRHRQKGSLMPHRWVSACIAGLVMFATPLAAQTTLPPISLGGGLRTSFVHDSPDGGDDTDTFALDSARLYISGPVTEQIDFMFNTELAALPTRSACSTRSPGSR